MTYENIPDEHSLDSMEGVEITHSKENASEIKKESIDDFIFTYNRLSKKNYIDTNSATALIRVCNNLGLNDLSKKIAEIYLKRELENTVKNDTDISHTVFCAYEALKFAGVDEEFVRKIGEILAKGYESGGSFSHAAKLYRETYPDKYADKLNSIKLSNDEPEKLPNDQTPGAYPQFSKISDQERELFIKSQYEEVLEIVPKEITEIDIKEEYGILMKNLGEIAEEYKKKEN